VFGGLAVYCDKAAANMKQRSFEQMISDLHGEGDAIPMVDIHQVQWRTSTVTANLKFEGVASPIFVHTKFTEKCVARTPVERQPNEKAPSFFRTWPH